MGAQRTSFAKLQRDRAKKAKAAAKREERQERPDPDAVSSEEVSDVQVADDGHELSAPELLKLIEHIHQQFDAKLISYDDFEERKSELLARLPID